MKIRATLLLALLASAGCQQAPFAEYTSQDGKFKAIFPGEPKVTTTATAGIVLKMYMVESWNKAYMIGWADMPIPDWESESRTKSRLFDARDGALAAVKGKSNNTTKTITLADRFPGIEFGGSAEGKHLRARVYLVGHRVYQMLVAGRSEEQIYSQEADDFFAAFQVIEPESLLAGTSGESTGVKASDVLSKMHSISSGLGRFDAVYPVKPKSFTRKIGDVNYKGHASEAQQLVCSIAYADLPIAGGEPIEKMHERLDAARESHIADSKGILQSNRHISLGEGRPGQEYTATIEGKLLRGKVYLIGVRLYQISVVGDGDKVNSKEAVAFFDSFKTK